VYLSIPRSSEGKFFRDTVDWPALNLELFWQVQGKASLRVLGGESLVALKLAKKVGLQILTRTHQQVENLLTE